MGADAPGPGRLDVASARITEAAVATTGAGVAWSLGARDGDELERIRALEAIARIVAAVDVPVTADIESDLCPRCQRGR